MSNSKRQNKAEYKVAVCYLAQRNWWIIFIIHKDDKRSTKYEILPGLVIDFSGERFKKRIESMAETLEEKYGITQKELEDAILQWCNDQKKKPPKCLRKNSQS